MPLPLRLRVTLAFAAVMAVVLGITGFVLYERFAAGLDDTIAESLEARESELATLVGDDVGALELAATPEVPFAVVVNEDGDPVALEDPAFDDQPGDAVEVIPEDELSPFDFPAINEENEPFTVDGSFFEDDEGAPEARFLISPIEDLDGLYLALGTPLDSRNAALNDLATLPWIALPLALVLSSGAAFGVASAALRPVESMRRRATEIPVTVDGERLPVPGSGDEIGRLGATLNEMLGRIEDGVARERALVADASHELRTPLAALQAELELAQREGRTKNELEDAVRAARKETSRLTALAEGMLLLARVDAGELTLDRAPTPAAPWLEDVVERCRRARDGAVPVAIAAAPELTLDIDREAAGRALGNVVDNALRYAESAVTVVATPIRGAVDIAVHDDGPGFPDGFTDAAFERFAQADGARSASGAGVGLSIARSIVEAHGGRVSAANDGGAVVRLTLPIA